MIHINHSFSHTCAKKSIEQMRELGGSWLIWTAEEEGVVMDRPESKNSSRILKYWPEIVVGTFNGSMGKRELARLISTTRTEFVRGMNVGLTRAQQASKTIRKVNQFRSVLA